MSPVRISRQLRERVSQTARHRCGYCLVPRSIIGPLLEIEHLIPEAHGGTSNEDNLWLACPMCNSHKSDRLNAIDPETGETVQLFNPRGDIWKAHFMWVDEGSTIQGITAIGRATVAALQMNHPE